MKFVFGDGDPELMEECNFDNKEVVKFLLSSVESWMPTLRLTKDGMLKEETEAEDLMKIDDTWLKLG